MRTSCGSASTDAPGSDHVTGPDQRLPREFFARSGLDVAPDLLGCLLSFGGVTLRLTELEAYAGPGPIAGSDLDVVSGYMDRLTGQGLSSRTIARRLSALKTFFRFLQNEGRLDADPSALVHAPRQGQS